MGIGCRLSAAGCAVRESGIGCGMGAVCEVGVRCGCGGGHGGWVCSVECVVSAMGCAVWEGFVRGV